MTRNLRAAFVWVVLACGTAGAAEPPRGHAEFVSDLISDVQQLASGAATTAERGSGFRMLLQRGFDLNEVGRLMLGRYWRRATPEQKVEFTDLVEDYVTRLYEDRFREIADVSVAIEGTKRLDGATMVYTTAVRPNGAAVHIDWRVGEVGGRLAITDIVVEGVSMVIAGRAEFSSIIRQSGGDIRGLLDLLRKRTGRS